MFSARSLPSGGVCACWLPFGLPVVGVIYNSERSSYTYMTLPNTVIIVSYNLWLIPFGGAWCLGRADRCTNALVAKANQLRPVASSSELVVVAVQEAWAFRVGIFWPLLWLLSRSESAMLRSRLVAGAHETLAHKFLKDVIFALTALSVLVVQSWIPLLRRVQWNPKLRMASTLKRDASLSWSTDDSVAHSSGSVHGLAARADGLRFAHERVVIGRREWLRGLWTRRLT